MFVVHGVLPELCPGPLVLFVPAVVAAEPAVVVVCPAEVLDGAGVAVAPLGVEATF